MEKYFIIRNNDGDTRVECVTKEELLKSVNEKDYGEAAEFLAKLPKESDTNYWGEGILIIKGTIVSPIAKTKITEFTID